MKTRELLGGLLAAVVLIVAPSKAAQFTSSFDNIEAGSPVSLAWEGVAPQYYPLCITAQLIERDGDGTKVNSYKQNITNSVTGGTFVWKGVPYPLRWLKTGLYQLELRPSASPEGEAQLLASSPFFQIKEQTAAPVSSGPSSSETTPSSSSKDASAGINKSLAIGLGVAIGIPSMAAFIVVGWCFRKRLRRATLERKVRLKRTDFVID